MKALAQGAFARGLDDLGATDGVPLLSGWATARGRSGVHENFTFQTWGKPYTN
ncbi:hypothetical protein SAMN05444680_12647 [Variovorax sp. YR216]|nr:hypothetical protein SAMN05444680_12647 [Variovorax sp. YR216]